MNILVGLSGGVDSSVTAMLLKEQGHNVIGATMAIWGNRGVKNKISLPASHGACLGPDEKEDIEAAKKLCNDIGIDFYVFDCAEQYNEIVLKNFREEYLSGKTPNPCIWCNSLIKFNVLPQLALLNGIEFDKFATGHYARVSKYNGRYTLKRGIDSKKDQSYFLYRLKQEQLKNIVLPLGDYTKSEIRKIAGQYGLEAAEKPDSQDFYAGDYNELLNISPKQGNIVDTKGNVLGKHNGIWNYTIGQRKGLGISAVEALYVIELREAENEVVVGFKDNTFSDYLEAENLNWISIEKLTDKINCQAKIRSTQQPVDVTISPAQDGSIKVRFENMQKSIAPGQSIVLYDGDLVLGGGIIRRSGNV